jgi:hypothetical protein
MKVEKKSESFYILGYLLEVILKFWRFEKHSSKFGEFGPFFPGLAPRGFLLSGFIWFFN